MIDINEALDQATSLEPVEEDQLAVLAALEHYEAISEEGSTAADLAYAFFLAGRLFQQEYIDNESAAEQKINISVSPEIAGLLIENLLSQA